ncbi:MAG: alpha-amylase [Muribaculaceae bacterium]|nr:alpha-amylase [Muribaculaceae bacterium]
MTQFFRKGLIGAALCAAAFSFSTPANAVGWPANHQGVMLQGFYWDSYTDTKWKNLEAQADELSKYFNLIWIPNSGYCGGGNNMGYMPQYWFTNHKSSFGTEAELLSMIDTYKKKGTGFIADCVINHRNGVTNWYNFPKEEWNGKTWQIGLEGICANDEMAYASGQPKPTGANDTGENFDGCRDLDHTNANVQDNCKNYVKCLQEKYGYVGMRYDMVKGYGGQYTKIYNQYANVKYSVGEYFDGNYDKVKGWIEATGKTSAAFDFPCKYAMNEAWASNDMRKLVWKANGTTDQPAGMIHCGYQQYAVTFVDNHDTYRDGSKFTGNELAANAFILMSPGTPCVFLPHYKKYKAAIQKLIEIRNAAGLHNLSPVTVLKTTQDCYMAEVTGTKGKVVVKIGGSMDSPSGYSNSDIKAKGDGYCVWSKVNVQGGGDTPIVGGDETPAKLYLLGNVKGAQWSTSASPAMTKSGDKFTINVTLEAAQGETRCYFNLADALGADWDELNATANRYGSTTEGEPLSNNSSAAMVKYANNVDASGCLSWTLAPGTYTITADFKSMKISVGNGSSEDPITPTPNLPEEFYVIGEVNGNDWACDNGVKMNKTSNGFTATIDVQGKAGTGYFSFTKGLASSWDALNTVGRFAPAADTELVPDGPAASFGQVYVDHKAFYVADGKYDLTVDWGAKTASIKKSGTSAIESVEIDDMQPVFFNLQGQKVENPQGGVFIKVTGKTAAKVRM